jgi:fluoride ion exporter CrcB/FEX
LKTTWKSLALVFAGGSLGTLLRFGLDITLGSFFAVAAVNIVGSAIIGWVNSDPRTSEVSRHQFWSVGFAGGFTTMSGVALLTASGITATLSVEQPVSFQLLGYVLGIFALSLLAYWGAYSLGERVSGYKARPIEDSDEVTK